MPPVLVTAPASFRGTRQLRHPAFAALLWKAPHAVCSVVSMQALTKLVIWVGLHAFSTCWTGAYAGTSPLGTVSRAAHGPLDEPPLEDPLDELPLPPPEEPPPVGPPVELSDEQPPSRLADPQATSPTVTRKERSILKA
jgi:hypothetical protein